jgi:hypothetical protein
MKWRGGLLNTVGISNQTNACAHALPQKRVAHSFVGQFNETV